MKSQVFLSNVFCAIFSTPTINICFRLCSSILSQSYILFINSADIICKCHLIVQLIEKLLNKSFDLGKDNRLPVNVLEDNFEKLVDIQVISNESDAQIFLMLIERSDRVFKKLYFFILF